MSTLKVEVGHGDLRRVNLPTHKFDAVMDHLQTVLGAAMPERRLYYVDEENDLITICTASDWDVFLADAQPGKPLRVRLRDPHARKAARAARMAQPGPAAVHPGARLAQDGKRRKEAAKLAQAPLERSSVGASKVSLGPQLSSEAAEALRPLLPPMPCASSDLPPWVLRCATLRASRAGTELIFNLRSLLCQLNHMAYSAIGEDTTQLQRARLLVDAVLAVDQNNTIALYNKGCIESIEGHLDDALELVCRAVLTGYSNFDHLRADPDFDNVRKSPTHAHSLAQLLGDVPRPERKRAPSPAATTAVGIDCGHMGHVTVEDAPFDEPADEKRTEAKPTKAKPSKAKPTEAGDEEVPEFILRARRWVPQLMSLRNLGVVREDNIDYVLQVLDRYNGRADRAANVLLDLD